MKCSWADGTRNLGDRVSLAVEIPIRMPDYYLSDELVPGLEWGPAYICEVKGAPPAAIPGTLRLDVSLQFFTTGEVALPPISMTMNSGGAKLVMEIKPPPIKIEPLLKDGQPAPPAAAPFPYPEGFPWVLLLGSLALAISLATWLWSYVRRKKLLAPPPAAPPKPQERDPDSWIRDEVERILRAEMDARTRYGLLSQRLREYFQIRTSHPFSDWTTHEIRNNTAALDLLPDEVREMLLRTLSLCDMAKFAKYEPKKEERDGAAETMRSMLAAYMNGTALKNE